MTLRSATWQPFAVVYMLVSLYLMTAHPSYFSEVDSSLHWLEHNSMSNILKNSLLLFPLGMLLRQTFNLSYWLVCCLGIVVGFMLEPTSLFEVSQIDRFHPITSTHADVSTIMPIHLVDHIIPKAVGGFLGAIFYDVTSSAKQKMSNITLAYMLIPLVWLISSKLLDTAIFVLLIPPIVMALLLLVHTETPFWIPRSIVLPVWIAITLGPLLNVQFSIGILLLGTVSLGLYAIAMDMSARSALDTCVPLLAIAFFILIAITVLEDLQWQSLSSRQQWMSHSVELSLLGICTWVAWIWHRNDHKAMLNLSSIRRERYPVYLQHFQRYKRKSYHLIRHIFNAQKRRRHTSQK